MGEKADYDPPHIPWRRGLTWGLGICSFTGTPGVIVEVAPVPMEVRSSRRQVCAVSFPSDSVLSKLRGVCREVGGGAERVSARTVLYKELSPVVLIQGQLGSQEIFSNV